MNQVASKGKVFVCHACGKMSKDQYGNRPISKGWDVSCMMNSQEEDESKLVIENERVIRINE